MDAIPFLGYAIAAMITYYDDYPNTVAYKIGEFQNGRNCYPVSNCTMCSYDDWTNTTGCISDMYPYGDNIRSLIAAMVLVLIGTLRIHKQDFILHSCIGYCMVVCCWFIEFIIFKPVNMLFWYGSKWVIVCLWKYMNNLLN
jgi:hypothetical protein